MEGRKNVPIFWIPVSDRCKTFPFRGESHSFGLKRHFFSVDIFQEHAVCALCHSHTYSFTKCTLTHTAPYMLRNSKDTSRKTSWSGKFGNQATPGRYIYKKDTVWEISVLVFSRPWLLDAHSHCGLFHRLTRDEKAGCSGLPHGFDRIPVARWR